VSDEREETYKPQDRGAMLNLDDIFSEAASDYSANIKNIEADTAAPPYLFCTITISGGGLSFSTDSTPLPYIPAPSGGLGRAPAAATTSSFSWTFTSKPSIEREQTTKTKVTIYHTASLRPGTQTKSVVEVTLQEEFQAQPQVVANFAVSPIKVVPMDKCPLRILSPTSSPTSVDICVDHYQSNMG
jgi:hypothetical protein